MAPVEVQNAGIEESGITFQIAVVAKEHIVDYVCSNILRGGRGLIQML